MAIHGLIGRGTEAGQDAECYDEHLGLLGLTQNSTSMLPTRLRLRSSEYACNVRKEISWLCLKMIIQYSDLALY